MPQIKWHRIGLGSWYLGAEDPGPGACERRGISFEAVIILTLLVIFSSMTTACLCLTLPVLGQTLRIESKPTAIGQRGIASIRINSSSTEKPLALQWDISIPEAAIQLDLKDIVAGDASASVGKSITCARAGAPAPDGYSWYRCLVAGGVSVIGNGSVAVLNFTTRPNGRPGRYKFRLTRALAVSRSLKKVVIKDTSGELVVAGR